MPKQIPTIVQDFSYTASHHAGRSPGEKAGLVTRAAAPTFYADKIGPRTLNDKLRASDTFAVTRTAPGGGRPICSLGMSIDCENGGCRIAVRLITGRDFSCGTFATPYLPGKFRPTPIRNDGTKCAWTLDYDPAAAQGRRRFTFTLTIDLHGATAVSTAELDRQLSRRQNRRARCGSDICSRKRTLSTKNSAALPISRRR